MGQKELTALLLEDDEDWMEKYQEIAERAGIENPDCAFSEDEALTYLQKKEYDVIMSDTMDGTLNPMGPNIAKKAREMGQKPLLLLFLVE